MCEKSDIVKQHTCDDHLLQFVVMELVLFIHYEITQGLKLTLILASAIYSYSRIYSGCKNPLRPLYACLGGIDVEIKFDTCEKGRAEIYVCGESLGFETSVNHYGVKTKSSMKKPPS